ncbi:hypothetical protein J31TS4_35880 [Paenibacillus sp. J31TS4]|uniref:DUF1934 domain-containing protein n=1 Tax=Paenibacillus sp. J31TS4 TaxID=2807195 RepID=UPI001B011B6F|nr:DUF1934 domain-containing protein [Paenibacillus sp. J31TS4]GIP40308.1 hypothetical protein J31TS4_35880 [Paenibacillus sp. J31TS4]
MAEEPNAHRRIALTVSSVSGHDRIRRRTQADLYYRNGRWFVRYEEPSAEMGRTMTTVRIDPRQIRVVRHGDVRSEQTFVRDERHPGYYETAQGRLPLAVRTRELEAGLSADGFGTVAWSYDLEVSDEPAGRFRLVLKLEPGPELD